MNNLNRMQKLVSDFYKFDKDLSQITVTPEETKLLKRIHPACISEIQNDDGPILWMVLIPTTEGLMKEFINNKISEKQLLQDTPTGVRYKTIYLCSCFVLPEFRKKGIAKNAAIKAINEIIKNQEIGAFFYWPFSKEGKLFAEYLSNKFQMPLYQRSLSN